LAQVAQRPACICLPGTQSPYRLSFACLTHSRVNSCGSPELQSSTRMMMRALITGLLVCSSQATQDSTCTPSDDGSCNVEALDDLSLLQAKVSSIEKDVDKEKNPNYGKRSERGLGTRRRRRYDDPRAKRGYRIKHRVALSGCWRVEGDYVTVPNGASGCTDSDAMEFGLVCNCGDDTHVTVRVEVIAPNGKDNSFRLQVDDGERVDWHLNHRSSWGWEETSFDVSSCGGIYGEGTNTDKKLKLLLREDGVKAKTIKVYGACKLAGG